MRARRARARCLSNRQIQRPVQHHAHGTCRRSLVRWFDEEESSAHGIDIVAAARLDSGIVGAIKQPPWLSGTERLAGLKRRRHQAIRTPVEQLKAILRPMRLFTALEGHLPARAAAAEVANMNFWSSSLVRLIGEPLTSGADRSSVFVRSGCHQRLLPGCRAQEHAEDVAAIGR